jgi:hypothetical protein
MVACQNNGGCMDRGSQRGHSAQQIMNNGQGSPNLASLPTELATRNVGEFVENLHADDAAFRN